LPGDDLAVAEQEIRDAIGDLSPYEVTIERSVHMWPALVEPGDPGIQALSAAHAEVVRQPPRTIYGLGTYDAGGPCSLGVPTVMYGASGGVWPLGTDFAPIAAVETEARVLAQLILDQLA
jgi:acetylornithine deacetylase/succinyl-diaminopimelate desuccinylase-like protein